MKVLLPFLFTLVLTGLYFFPSNSFSVSSPSLTLLTGRRSMREHVFYEKDKVIDEGKGQMEFPENIRAHEQLSNDDLEAIYHIDYNGVTTHPIPTPKHPRP